MATFAIDAAHTDVLFSAKHMMVTTVRGTFTDVSGTVELDETDPTASHAEIVVKAASLDTGFGARDTHLRSDDFFGAETYPEIRVMSTAVRPTGGNDYVVTADVTIRDVTRSVDFDVEFLGFYSGMDGVRRPASTRGPRSTARTGISTGTSPSRRAAGWSATGQARSRCRGPGACGGARRRLTRPVRRGSGRVEPVERAAAIDDVQLTRLSSPKELMCIVVIATATWSPARPPFAGSIQIARSSSPRRHTGRRAPGWPCRGRRSRR